ncbi:MAG: hypothetical protein RL139_930 [Gemmatimonadota bacterium]
MSALLLTLPFVLVVAVFTGAATALRSVSRLWLRHWAEQQLAGATTATLYLERPHQLLLAAGTAIAGTVFALGAVLGSHIANGLWAVVNAWLWAAALLLVVGQLVPRALARRWPAEALAFLWPPLRLADRMVAPWAALATHLVTRRGGPAAATTSTQEALEDLLREGEVEGVGAPEERAIISGVVEFGARRVGEAMTPRAEIVAVDRDASPAGVARLVAQSKLSRLPVYRGTLDQVEGMVTSWDVIARPDAPLRALRPVAIATVEEACQSLMRRMLRDRRHLAIVQGPGGETVGLVTLEDLVEEVVGDIHDEHDEVHPER